MSFYFRRPRSLFSTQTGISLALIAALVLGCDRPDPTEPPLSGPTPSLVSSLSIAAVAASAHDGNVPENTLDNDLETWWAAQGDGQWIRYDLGATTGVSRVDIAWYVGDTRRSFFDIEVSVDAVSWTTVFTGQSSGQTLQLERYNFPTSSARYVRIVGHGSTTGTGWNSITELDIYQTTTISVTTSTHDGHVPENTLDNDLETRWSAQGDGHWIRYDLGATTGVSRVDIAWYAGDARISFFDIEVSADAVSWTTVFTGESSGQTRNHERYNLPISSARYVRIVGHGSSSGTGWNSITEVDIYQTPLVTVTASDHDGNVPQNTLDNNLSTWWAAQGDGHWIRYDLGAMTEVGRVDIAWYVGDTRSSFFDIEVSADAVSWSNVFSGQSSGQTLQLERYDVPASSARYVRIVGHGSTTGTGWNSITEVDIYHGGGGSPPLEEEPEPVGYFVATDGGTGAGTINDPWSLTYAFGGAGGKFGPGDTIWIRGGDYVGTFPISSSVSGTSDNNRIVFRRYPNERPILKTALFNDQFVVNGNWLLLWAWSS